MIALQKHLLTTSPCGPLPGVAEALKDARAKGARVVFITCRDRSLEAATAAQLKMQGLPYEDLLVIGEGRRKGGPILEWVRKHRGQHGMRTVVLVDDKEEQLQSLARRMSLGLCEHVELVLFKGQLLRSMAYHATYPERREQARKHQNC